MKILLTLLTVLSFSAPALAARSFSGGTHQLHASSHGGVTSAGTIFLRARPNWNHNDSATHVLFQFGSSSEAPSFQKFSDNNIYIGFNGGGHGDQRISVAADSAMFLNGVWTSHVFTWDDAAEAEYYYADNVQKGSRTTTLTTFSASTLTLGNYDPALLQVNFNGALAEFGRWSRVLDAAEREIIQKTGTPLSVLRGLVEYKPLVGRYSPEIDLTGGASLAVTGAGAADHPRVLYPRR